ncbi:10152_t:CDS:1, partial [Ambispora gerdemannii]
MNPKYIFVLLAVMFALSLMSVNVEADFGSFLKRGLRVVEDVVDGVVDM